MRLLSLTAPLSLVASLSLMGCTIYTYSGPPPKGTQTKTRKPSTTKTTTGIIRKPVSSSGSSGTQSATTAPGDAPLVKSKIIFGGPSVAAFKGQAFVIPERTTKLPNFADLVPFATFYTDRFAIAEQEFSGGFPGALLQDEWFAIQYNGNITMPASSRVTFKLVSDDGAALYIDDKKLIDNDGVHTTKEATGQTTLSAGQHTLRLDYFQAKKGMVALQLFLVTGGQDVPVIGVR